MNVEVAQATDSIILARRAFAPAPDLTVSEFADAEIRVTGGPREGTRWRTDFAPYQRGIMDAFSEPRVETLVVMCSAQVGKTAIALNLVAYHIAHDPCPILVVQPTARPMAEEFSKNRLDPLIKASPILSRAVSKKRSRDSTNTILAKTFIGGSISIGGANSAASLAARSVRLLLLDEIERFPPELPGEGSTISIVLARTKSFGRSRRVGMFSSPTIVGGPIHSWYLDGDQREYHVYCPGCGVLHPYEWCNVKWPPGAGASAARLHCPECDYPFDDVDRIGALTGGEWIAGNPDREDKTIVSFHLSELYSPFSELTKIVDGFHKARRAQKAGDPSLMHTWQNTTLGEPIELELGVGVESKPLLLRREDYGDCDVPAGGCLLTMGVDTQDDRLELIVYAWGPGQESWIIDRDTLPGDPDEPAVWEMLDLFLDYGYQHASGAVLMVTATCIDSAGHRTDAVYDYCHRRASRNVYATIGRDGERAIIASPALPRRRARGGRKCPLYTIGVDAVKSLFVSWLKRDEPGPGYVHIPLTAWADEELIAQLTSERLVTRWKKGTAVYVWRKTRPRNEMLDCTILAIAALRRLGRRADLDTLAARLNEPPVEIEAQDTPVREPGFLGSRRQGWLRPH